MSIVSKLLKIIKSFRREIRSPAKPDYGIHTVKFDPSLLTKPVKADIRKNVNLIEGISPEHFGKVYDAAVRSVTAGRDLQLLMVAIMQLNIPGITRKRAGQIAHSLNNKATAVITRERQTSLGITQAIWRYSGAPCEIDPRNPSGTQDAAHEAANNQLYEVSKGMFLDGKWTWPGYEDGCRCVSAGSPGTKEISDVLYRS
ncbi:MAG: hypothetical protein ACYDBH_13235 [Acidobacteriaceae bacterium]